MEFGHKVLLCESAEKFITDYKVYEKQEADCDLTESVIQRHEKLFGERPEVLAADKGFCPAEAKFAELAARWIRWRYLGGCEILWTRCWRTGKRFGRGSRGLFPV